MGMHIDDATQTLEEQDFEVEVQDSVYIDTLKGLTVIRQSPEADAEVKAGRKVYVTITRLIPPLVDMPDLRGFSYLSAEHHLQSLGLNLGDTIYKPDIAKNFVLDQLYKGAPVKPGTKVNMGSEIDLVLGSGVGSTSIAVPDLVGLTFKEAQDKLSALNINLGAVVVDPGVKDKNIAYVREQNPPAISEPIPGQKILNKIRAGQIIDLTLSASPPPPKVEEPAPADPVKVSENPPTYNN